MVFGLTSFKAAIFSSAICANRYSLPARRAVSPVTLLVLCRVRPNHARGIEYRSQAARDLLRPRIEGHRATNP